MSHARSINLRISGEVLTLKTDRDEHFLQELADYVGSKIDEIQQGARGIPSHRVYLLAALQLADELYAERENGRVLCEEVSTRSERLMELVDVELAALQQGASGIEPAL